MKKVAILQSNYIPWKGYFDLINMVDEFVLYDDMQYTKRDWRNRNLIKTPNGIEWLSIPVEVKGKYFQTIQETKISDPKWNENHWNKIQQNYSKAACFKEYKEEFKEFYLNCKFSYLSEVNYAFIKKINSILDINTKITWSKDLDLVDGKTERLVGICKTLNATEYISGPAAKDYIDQNLFDKEDIVLSWMNYSEYKEYPQVFPPFEHGVTILDLIFNIGSDSVNCMKTF